MLATIGRSLRRTTSAVASPSGYLTDEQHHRRRVLKGGVDAYGGVRRTRPPRDKTYARSAGQLAVSFRHVACGTFMARTDERYFRYVVESIQHGKIVSFGRIQRFPLSHSESSRARTASSNAEKQQVERCDDLVAVAGQTVFRRAEIHGCHGRHARHNEDMISPEDGDYRHQPTNSTREASARNQWSDQPIGSCIG